MGPAKSRLIADQQPCPASHLVVEAGRRSGRDPVVDGYASAANGLPRATGDRDVWIPVDREYAERILDALDDVGFGGLGLTEDDFLNPGRVLQLGFPPFRIDLLTAIDGVTFSEAWPRRLLVEVVGVAMPVIGREDLVANKVAADRLQDRADVAWLRAAWEGPDEQDT